MAANLLALYAERKRCRCSHGGILGMSRCLTGLITVLTLAIFAPRADATVLFSASGGGLSAQASFEITTQGGKTYLNILLSNTDTANGAGAPLVPSQVLTGLFFNLGSTTFT